MHGRCLAGFISPLLVCLLLSSSCSQASLIDPVGARAHHPHSNPDPGAPVPLTIALCGGQPNLRKVQPLLLGYKQRPLVRLADLLVPNPWAADAGAGHGRKLAQSQVTGLPSFPGPGQSGATAAGHAASKCPSSQTVQ